MIKIVEKIKYLSFGDLKKRTHYEISILGKDTNEKLLADYFNRFDKIKMINFRKRLTGYNNYDFFYVREDGTYIIYSINIEKNPPELINAIPINRNFEKFRDYILKKHKKLF